MKSTSFKFVFVFLLSIAVIFSISACGASSDTDGDPGDAAATEAPDATEAPATEAPAGDIVAAFKFTNTGTAEICELYLSPADTTDWGPDQLGGQTIAAGAEFTLKNIPAGTYDAKAVGCNGSGEATLSLDIYN